MQIEGRDHRQSRQSCTFAGQFVPSFQSERATLPDSPRYLTKTDRDHLFFPSLLLSFTLHPSFTLQSTTLWRLTVALLRATYSTRRAASQAATCPSNSRCSMCLQTTPGRLSPMGKEGLCIRNSSSIFRLLKVSLSEELTNN